jgi:hypothetical protein
MKCPPLDYPLLSADNHHVVDREDVQVHPRWIEAQAAIQADCDRDVLDEAAGLAEAELSQITLRDLIHDSVGGFIHIRMPSGRSLAVIAGILSGTLRGDSEGMSVHWIVIDGIRAVNVGSFTSVRGLKRFVSPGLSGPSKRGELTRELGLHAWLRDRIGLRVAVYRGTYICTGVLIEVGADFVGILQGQHSELFPLTSIDELEIV